MTKLRPYQQAAFDAVKSGKVLNAPYGMGKTRYSDPSPPQAELDLEPYSLVPAISWPDSDCPRPTRLSQDQYKCNLCGLVWDTDEERPSCISKEQTDGKPHA